MKYTDFIGEEKIKITAEVLNKSWDTFSKNIKDSLADEGGSHYNKARYLSKIVPDYQSFVTHIRFFIDNWNDNPVFTETFKSGYTNRKRLAIGQDEDGGMVWLKGQPASNTSDLLLIVGSCPDIYDFLFPKYTTPITEEPPEQRPYEDDYFFYGYD